MEHINNITFITGFIFGSIRVVNFPAARVLRDMNTYTTTQIRLKHELTENLKIFFRNKSRRLSKSVPYRHHHERDQRQPSEKSRLQDGRHNTVNSMLHR